MQHRDMGYLAIALAIGIASTTIHSAVPASAAEMISYDIVDEGVPKAFSTEAGNADRGKKIYANRKKGNCLACHVTADLKDMPFHGEIGPPMDGVASRYSAAQIRLRIANPKVLNDDTIMPAFYRNDGFTRVLKKFKGKTVLSAQEVEDVIAYLMTMKDE